MSDPERLAVAQLKVSYSQLDWAMRSATNNKAKAPPFAVFLPDAPVDEPEEVRTFDWWAKKLLPLAGGRV